MIFAELAYPEDYWDLHEELKQYLSTRFARLESGIQSDSWFWIHDGEEKVSVDTFSSMKHQVKAAGPCPLVQRVIDVLAERYKLKVYPEPVLEEWEDV